MLEIDVNGSWRARVEVTKADDAEMRIFGFAMTATDANGAEVTDHQGDVISPDEMAEAAFDYAANAGAAGVMHRPSDPGFVADAGHMIASIPLTPEIRKAMGVEPGPSKWFVGLQITKRDVWKRFQSGELKELSVEGTGVREEIAA